MPLTPSEQQELAQLNSEAQQGPKMAAASPSGLSPEEHAELAQLNSEAGQSTQPSQQQAPKRIGDGIEGMLPDSVKNAIGAAAAYKGNALKSLTMGNLTPPGQNLDQLSNDHPAASMAGKASGIAQNAAVVGALGGSAAEGMGFLGRQGINAAQGGITGLLRKPEGEDSIGARLGNAGSDAASSAALGLGGEGLVGLITGGIRGAGTLKRAVQMKTGSPALKDEAAQAMSETAQKLRSTPAKPALDADLAGKTVTISPQEYLKSGNPEVAALIKGEVDKVSPYGTVPQSLDIGADTLNKIRGHLDKDVGWKNVAFGSQEAAKAAQSADQATRGLVNNTRDTLHDLSPEISDNMDTVNKSIRGAQFLEKKSARPLATLSSKAPDTAANIKDLGNMAGTNLGDYASQIKSAREINKHPVLATIPETLFQSAKGAAKGIKSNKASPEKSALLQALLDLKNGSGN